MMGRVPLGMVRLAALKELKKGSAFFFQSSNFLHLGSSGISTVQRLFMSSCSFFQSHGDCIASMKSSTHVATWAWLRGAIAVTGVKAGV